MSAEVLRAAACVIRERAEGAADGPWEPSDCEGGPLVERAGVTDQIVAGCGWWEYPQARANASHIASWHPLVALAVADWLDAEATELARRAEWGFPTVPPLHALSVAQAYLEATP